MWKFLFSGVLSMVAGLVGGNGAASGAWGTGGCRPVGLAKPVAARVEWRPSSRDATWRYLWIEGVPVAARNTVSGRFWMYSTNARQWIEVELPPVQKDQCLCPLGGECTCPPGQCNCQNRAKPVFK